MLENFVFCNDMDGMVDAMGIKHTAKKWCLFINTSKVSLKVVLLHNSNKLPSIPIGYVFHMKETYDNIGKILCRIWLSNF